jgi:hypothetical protein
LAQSRADRGIILLELVDARGAIALRRLQDSARRAFSALAEDKSRWVAASCEAAAESPDARCSASASLALSERRTSACVFSSLISAASFSFADVSVPMAEPIDSEAFCESASLTFSSSTSSLQDRQSLPGRPQRPNSAVRSLT